MNFRTTLILLVLLLGAGIFLFIDHAHTPPAQVATPAAPGAALAGRKLFEDVIPKDVSALTINFPDTVWALERQKGNWRFTKPVQGRADTWEVDGLVHDLLELSSRAQLDVAGASTGLAQPRYRIEMKIGDNKTLSLAVGDKTALGDAMYVQVAGSTKADVVQSDGVDRLEKPIDDLRDKAMLDTSATDIQRLEIARAGAPAVELARRDNGWRIVRPIDAPADDSAVQSVLGTVTGLRATDFVKNADAQRTELDHPQLTVRLSTTAPSTQPGAGYTSIAFGQYQDIRREKLYATVVGSADVVMVSNYVMDSLNKSALDLRDRKVLDLDPQQVSKITLQITGPQASSKLTIEHKKSVVLGPMINPLVATTGPAATAPATEPASPWAITSSKGAFANEARVDAVLAALHPLHAEQYLTKDPVTQPAQVTRYSLKITAQATASSTDYQIDLVDRGDAKNLVGTCGGLVFEVNRALLNSLGGDFTTPPKVEAPSNVP